MRAFLVSLVLIVVVSAAAAAILVSLDTSSATVFQSGQGNVRL